MKKGDRIKLISVHGLPHPLHVTDDYLREREDWTITPCDRCGASECFDPPSVMARVRFPDVPPDQVDPGVHVVLLALRRDPATDACLSVH